MAKRPCQYLVILTMQEQNDPGVIQFGYVTRKVTPEPGWTRLDLLLDAQAQLPENVRGGTVVFFSAEPLEMA